MDGIDKKYEKAHLRHMAARESELRTLYENAIHDIVVAFSTIQYNGLTFYLKDYPLLLNRINQQIQKLHASIYATTLNAIQASWGLANEKNDLFVDKRLAGKIPSLKAHSVLYDSNRAALEAFVARKEQCLNLSGRIWNTLDGYKVEMEAALGLGISEGKSAAHMATDLKKYLNEPDRLFRRVRGDDGKLKLSKAAKNYHPVQGQYRSSFLNAKRLTVTESNLAYQNSDHERWAKIPFIIGVRVSTSNNHPLLDICDSMAGVYSKEFRFNSWHPFCRCHAVPIQISDAEYDKYEDALLAGTTPPEIKQIEGMPAKAKQWVRDNADRINGWANTPYFVRNNPKFIKELLK